MFELLHLLAKGSVFGGEQAGEAAPPKKADRPPIPLSKPAEAAAPSQDADAAKTSLFDGMIDEVSADLKDVAGPQQLARFEELRHEAPTEGRSQGADSQAIDDAIAGSKEAGGSRVDQILAGARADHGKVTFNGGGFLTGQERLIDMMRDTAGNDITEKGDLQTGNGKIHNGKTSWCGIWATDIWRRAGVPVKWDLNKGTIVDEETGEALKQESVNATKQTDLAKVQPGDIITVQTLPAGPAKIPGGTPPKNLNHHAIVESTVYKMKDGEGQVTVPPDQPPEGGTIIGYNVQEGNAPQKKTGENGEESYNSIHTGFVPAKLEHLTDNVGNKAPRSSAAPRCRDRTRARGRSRPR
jgi:hypothetical protein